MGLGRVLKITLITLGSLWAAPNHFQRFTIDMEKLFLLHSPSIYSRSMVRAERAEIVFLENESPETRKSLDRGKDGISQS